jgi:hypothetical protein
MRYETSWKLREVTAARRQAVTLRNYLNTVTPSTWPPAAGKLRAGSEQSQGLGQWNRRFFTEPVLERSEGLRMTFCVLR